MAFWNVLLLHLCDCFLLALLDLSPYTLEAAAISTYQNLSVKGA